MGRDPSLSLLDTRSSVGTLVVAVAADHDPSRIVAVPLPGPRASARVWTWSPWSMDRRTSRPVSVPPL